MEFKIFFLFSLFCILLAIFAGCGGPIDHCCPPPIPEPNYSIITNTTESDPIIGHWEQPNDKMIRGRSLFFYRDAQISKGNRIDRSIIIGKWTKVTDNEYNICWTGKRSVNFDIMNWTNSINETITYNILTDSVRDSAGTYFRYNATMDNNPDYS